MSGLLLDTHAFLWLMLDDPRVPVPVRAQVLGAEAIYVSAASAWEIRTKYRLGKLPEAGPYVAHLAAAVRRAGFQPLPVTFDDGDLAGSLAAAHTDPFDRVLAAQALTHRLALVSNDAALDVFGIVRIW